MAQIVPCVTATDAHQYREQMARLAPFANRIHIDFSDGDFSPVKLINPIQAYWPEGKVADLHLMVKQPEQHLETVISLGPQMVIIHAESKGNLTGIVLQLRALGIKTGVALLQPTEPYAVKDVVSEVDHVLIFSGDLGHFGGTADMTLLKKITDIRAINPVAEIGWDGGVGTDNAAQLALAGIEVLNAGGAIQKSADPAAAFKELSDLAARTNA